MTHQYQSNIFAHKKTGNRARRKELHGCLPSNTPLLPLCDLRNEMTVPITGNMMSDLVGHSASLEVLLNSTEINLNTNLHQNQVLNETRDPHSMSLSFLPQRDSGNNNSNSNSIDIGTGIDVRSYTDVDVDDCDDDSSTDEDD